MSWFGESVTCIKCQLCHSILQDLKQACPAQSLSLCPCVFRGLALTFPEPEPKLSGPNVLFGV